MVSFEAAGSEYNEGKSLYMWNATLIELEGGD